jgi:hypothetical protein
MLELYRKCIDNLAYLSTVLTNYEKDPALSTNQILELSLKQSREENNIIDCGTLTKDYINSHGGKPLVMKCNSSSLHILVERSDGSLIDPTFALLSPLCKGNVLQPGESTKFDYTSDQFKVIYPRRSIIYNPTVNSELYLEDLYLTRYNLEHTLYPGFHSRRKNGETLGSIIFRKDGFFVEIGKERTIFNFNSIDLRLVRSKIIEYFEFIDGKNYSVATCDEIYEKIATICNLSKHVPMIKPDAFNL